MNAEEDQIRNSVNGMNSPIWVIPNVQNDDKDTMLKSNKDPNISNEESNQVFDGNRSHPVSKNKKHKSKHGFGFPPTRHRHFSNRSTTSWSTFNESEVGSFKDALSLTYLEKEKPCRKNSFVFFSPFGIWSAENILKSFRQLPSACRSLFQAAWDGETASIEELLNIAGCSVDSRDEDGRTPLHLAAARGHYESVDHLLRRGALVDANDNLMKATPLMCAAASGSLNCVEVLVDAGADVNAGLGIDKTPLHWAVHGNSIECVNIFLKNGAKLNSSSKVPIESPLHIAAFLGNATMLQFLLDHGADATFCGGPNQSTALHLAAEDGHACCIQILLKGGSNKEATDSRGQTALHISTRFDAECTSILLAAGANIHARDKNGRTPLHSGIKRDGRPVDCMQQLLERQAEVNAQDNSGYTPLHLAAVNESVDCASLLLQYGADVTLKNIEGITAMSLLASKIPNIISFLVGRLNSAISIFDHEPGDSDCEVWLDLRAIIPNSKNIYETRITPPRKRQSVQKSYHEPRKETEFLTCILNVPGSKKVLNHPLTEAFLTLKWRRVRKIFWASHILQVVFVILFTIFVVNAYLIQCPFLLQYHFNFNITVGENSENNPTLAINFPNEILDLTLSRQNKEYYENDTKNLDINSEYEDFNLTKITPKIKKLFVLRTLPTQPIATDLTDSFVLNSTTCPNKNSTATAYFELNFENGTKVFKLENPTIRCPMGESWQLILWCTLLIFTVLIAIIELYQLIQDPKFYVVCIGSWSRLLLICCVVVLAWPIHMPDLYISTWWQHTAASFGILVAWGLVLIQVTQIPALGIYIQMLAKVTADFSIIIPVYVCFLNAFALAFSITFPFRQSEDTKFWNIWKRSILKVFTMMVGDDDDYEELFVPKCPEFRQPTSIDILYILFIVVRFIGIIIIMNLLFGLAVSDIQCFQKEAQLNRLSQQLALISRLEAFIFSFSKRVQAILPTSVFSAASLQRRSLLATSSDEWDFYFHPNDPNDKCFPKELKQELLRIASARYNSIPSYKNDPNTYRASAYGTSATQKATNTDDEPLKRLENTISELKGQLDYIIKTVDTLKENK